MYIFDGDLVYKKNVMGDLSLYGYKLKSILIDDGKKVTCKIYNYLGEFQESYNGVILLDYEGIENTIQIINGVGEINFNIHVGESIIFTKNKKMDNSILNIIRDVDE